MRHSSCLTSLLATFVAVGVVISNSSVSLATDTLTATAQGRNNQNSTRPVANFAALGAPSVVGFDVTDQRAALESVQYALSEIGDGSSYVWHRGHGKLSGVVQPTQSFKDHQGKVCRHFVVMLASGTYSKRTETVACRMTDGIWQLDG